MTKSLTDDVAVIILCGGEGKRLSPLTKSRCKPAVSFGGRYKLVDVPISHALTSGLSEIFIIGQYLAKSLKQHVLKTYSNRFTNSALHFLVPEKEDGRTVWYKGTADAIRQNLKKFRESKAKYFLILSGDQLYNINFSDMIFYAKQRKTSLVIAAQPVSEKDASRMGVLRINSETHLILDFYEKPQTQVILDKFKVYDSIEKPFLGSMGIYLFCREVLFDLLLEDPREDFGQHLIQTQIKKNNVSSYLYDGYWADIGTIDSYYKANLELTKKPFSKSSGLSCHKNINIIFNKHHHLPGAIISNSVLNQSLLCEGVVVDSCKINRSIVGVRTVVNKNSVIHDSIILGNDYYDYELVNSKSPYHLGIGSNCIINKTIVDENVRIGSGVRLVNKKKLQHFDSPDGLFFIRDGIIIIPKGTTIPNNYRF